MFISKQVIEKIVGNSPNIGYDIRLDTPLNFSTVSFEKSYENRVDSLIIYIVDIHDNMSELPSYTSRYYWDNEEDIICEYWYNPANMASFNDDNLFVVMDSKTDSTISLYEQNNISVFEVHTLIIIPYMEFVGKLIENMLVAMFGIGK